MVSTPCDPHVPLSYPHAQDTDTPIPQFPCQKIVGSLLYLATHSRPYIAHAVSVVVQYANNFREIHCTAIKRILKYLRGTTDFSLFYSRDPNEHHVLTAFTDADYAGDLNDRKSRSGSILFLNNGPVIWLSRKQPCTASSTIESEYVVASLTSKEIVWARSLRADLGFLNLSLLHFFLTISLLFALFKIPSSISGQSTSMCCFILFVNSKLVLTFTTFLSPMFLLAFSWQIFLPRL